ncbi:unnamed protein product [Durusdinium trenchii]|uniref:Mitochondrial escape protein 2 C-terminal domain-containing protein n=2 Tax=Durusdinium trenchii TaxID=1381693 RepID=A0ABP0MQC2_9DINO
MALNDPPPRHATPALAGRLSALGLVLSLLLQGCGQQKGLCEKGDATCKELQALQQSLGSCNELHPDSRFVGNPKITDISGTCAAVEFLYASQQMPVVYLYGRVARDADFTAEWGEGLHPLELEGESPEMAELKGKLPPELKVRRYRTLMRHIPTHKAFEVKLADEEDAAFEGSAFSCSSEPEVTLPKKLHPAAPYEVQLHRTDPRTNVKNEEGSVCVDLHWSHPFPQLKLVPEDAYFRVWMQYEGEPKKQFCEDQLGVWKRRCGVQMPSASGAFGRQSFTTICGLWPSRRVTFTVEAFTCDGRAAADVITATLPPDAPSFTASLITTPANQESSAGFWPKVLIDWIPQHDDLIQGHSLYLSLKGIGAMKLICWISRQERRGQMSLPIQKKNHTHSRDAALLHDYLQRYHVHQEQEVLVATRSVANISRPGRNKEKDEFLESPVSAFSLGDWLIMEKYVKCLTSFNAQQPSYVSSAVQLSWTEEQSMLGKGKVTSIGEVLTQPPQHARLPFSRPREATPARDGHRKRGDEANEANGAKERAAARWKVLKWRPGASRLLFWMARVETERRDADDSSSDFATGLLVQPQAWRGTARAHGVDCLGFLNPQLVRTLAVREAIRPLFPESDVCGFVSGELEGSRAFRVAVPDIELVVSVSPELLRQKLLGKLERKLDKQLEKAAIRSIAEILVTSCGFKFRRSAFRGEEPKLTLLAPGGDAEAVPLDLAVNAETPLYAAALLSECAQWDLRAKQLILLVRRWAKDRGICHAAKGYLSPYHWSLLVIYFLQVCPRVLPPLTAFMTFQQLSSKGSASSPDDAPRPEPNPVHTSKLFKDFMHFYQDFDWRNEMINPISGSPGKSTFEETWNCLKQAGNGVGFARTQEEFARAGAICAEGVAVGRIFELWVPPTGGRWPRRGGRAQSEAARKGCGILIERRQRFWIADPLIYCIQAVEGDFCDLQEVLQAAKEESDEVEEKPEKVSSARGVLWVANVYPTKAFRFDMRHMLTRHNHETLIPQLLPDGVEVTRMVPREKEGGAFVYFRAPPTFVLQALRNLAESNPEAVTKMRFVPTDDILLKVSEGICQYFRTHDVRAFLCPHPVRAHRVKGTPYLEDFASRYPSSQLQIRFDPTGQVKEEQLYEILRRYGQLEDLQATEQGYLASFRYTAGAVAARNCLHRALVEAKNADGPRFQIDYKQFMQKWIWETITSNARLIFPIFVVLMFGTTYFIWDPMRSAFVHLKIASIFSSPPPSSKASNTAAPSSVANGSAEVSTGYQGLQGFLLRFVSEARASLRPKTSARDLFNDFWAERQAEIAELKDWVDQPPERVLLLTGHRGNGLHEMMKKLIGGRTLEINVRDMLEAGGAADDHLFLRAFSRAVGYWPAQGMDRQLSAVLDLMLPGSGKQLSRENELLVAVQRVLFASTQALQAWKARSSASLKFDATPLILITGFTSENKDRRPGFFEALVSWAAYVTEAKLARVVFVADSSFGEPSILAHLKDRPERLSVFEVQDIRASSVRRILQHHLDDTALSDQQLKAIGGRYMDISAMLGHMRHGVAPNEAVRWLLETAEVTVRRLLLTGQPNARWTRPQLWRAIRLLESSGKVPYDVVLWGVFRGDEAALRSMKESNLIAVNPRKSESESALRYDVEAGSPLYAEVFRRLVQNEGLGAVLDLEVAKEDVAREQKTVDLYEAELVRLEEILDARRDWWFSSRRLDAQLESRVEQLVDLIMEQHKKLEKYHKARRKAMNTLAKHADSFQEDVRRVKEKVLAG